MAGGSFFILLDDIAAILDDVAAMTKVAAKKTAGVVGDDLAVNAQQVTGVSAERELPIVWQVAKGSFWNKVKKYHRLLSSENVLTHHVLISPKKHAYNHAINLRRV